MLTKILYEEIYRDGSDCAGCEWNRIMKEYHPYGNTVAEEILRECMVDAVENCPEVRKGKGYHVS